MTSFNRRLTQARSIKLRAKEAPQDPGEHCLVQPCGRLTQRAAQRGLSINYCKVHINHIQRHGHTTAKSFRNEVLKPYRKAAQRWLMQNALRIDVRQAIMEMEWLMGGERAEESKNMRSRPPQEKVRMVLARIREAGKTGGQLLEIVLTSLAAVKEHGPSGCPEFRYIQTAKLAKRLRGVSGTHVPSEIYGDWHKYPSAAGAYMRILGQRMEERVGGLLEKGVVEEVITLANTGPAT